MLRVLLTFLNKINAGAAEFSLENGMKENEQKYRGQLESGSVAGAGAGPRAGAAMIKLVKHTTLFDFVDLVRHGAIPLCLLYCPHFRPHSPFSLLQSLLRRQCLKAFLAVNP